MALDPEVAYEFGPFRLLPTEHLLLRDGRPVPLKPKTFDLLQIFVESGGCLLTKQDLMGRLWPESFVEEHNLAVVVFELRKALGFKSGAPSYIETVPRLGYRFLADVKVLQRREGGQEANPQVESVRCVGDGSDVPPLNPQSALADDGPPETNLRGQLRGADVQSDSPAVPPEGKAPLRVARPGRKFVLAAAVLLLAGAGIAFVLNTFPVRSLPPPGTVPDFHQLRVSRITSTGNVREAVISPDGKYIAYVELINGQQSLWIRQAASASKVQILPPAAVSLRGLAFSPDGNFVYYLKSAEDGANTLYYLPVLGGLPKEVLTGIESQVSFSPDGRRIAFVRWQQNPRGSLLMTANADGTGQQQLASRRSPEFFSNGGGPAWSPDGEVVAVTAGSSRAGVLFNVVGVRVDGRGEQPITSRAIASITGASWLPDGSGMIITAADQERMSCSNNQLWHVGYPGGAIRRVTNDLNNYGQASVTADASALLTTAEEQFSGIWVKGSDKAGSRAVRLNSGRNDGRAGLSWVPGGGIVYSSDGGGVDSILVMQADGGSPRTLVSHMLNMTPAVSPDGRMILFVSFRGGVPHIWRMDIDGNHQQQLTDGAGEILPQFSPDGRSLLYIGTADSGRRVLWKMPIDGGPPEQLTDVTTNMPAVSPDGAHIAYLSRDEGRWRVSVMPFGGGPPTKTLDMPPNIDPMLARPMRWAPDGSALTYVDGEDDGVSNIWSLPLDGTAPKRLTAFKEQRVFHFDWARGGRQLIFSRGFELRDAVLLANLQ